VGSNRKNEIELVTKMMKESYICVQFCHTHPVAIESWTVMDWDVMKWTS
jgi:hypothetical protein